MRTAIVIPARRGAQRFPGKLLAPLGDRAVIAHTVDAARRVRNAAEVIVATDDVQIGEVAERRGARVVLVTQACASGTDRVAIASAQIAAERIVNLQGDEPFVDPQLVERLIDAMQPGEVTTARTSADEEASARPSVVKVVCREDGRALYFSRAAIPFGDAQRHRHIGIYGFDRATLMHAAALPVSPLERAEGLEQLRWLEAGIPIRVIDAPFHAPGIDTPDDLARAARHLAQS